MIPQLPSYRPFGQPAVAYVDILKMPTAGDKITLNGVDIVFGTDIFGVGQTPFKVAQAFAEQIRGEVNNDGHNSRTFVGLITAVAYGSVNGTQTARLVFFATEPGTAGNAFTLTTNAATTFAVSGATFSGGTVGPNVVAGPKQYSTVSTATPATADATVFTLAAGEKGMIQNLSADAPLAYKLGASASTSSFNGVLQACSVQDDGKGGSVIIDDFIGAVSVAKITGTARYIAYKLS